jgi:hypothetical protein
MKNITFEDRAQLSSNFKEQQCQKIQRVNNSTRKKHKITILGDSHARNCATELQNNLCVTFEVSTFVKPVVRMSVIMDTVKEEIENLNNEDVVVVAGGANDTSKSNSKEAVKHICNCVEKRRNTNTVIANIPHRHDLMPSLC